MKKPCPLSDPQKTIDHTEDKIGTKTEESRAATLIQDASSDHSVVDCHLFGNNENIKAVTAPDASVPNAQTYQIQDADATNTVNQSVRTSDFGHVDKIEEQL